MVQALGGLPDQWGIVFLAALLAAAVLLILFHLFRLKRLKSLLASERRLKDLMDRSPLGIVVYRDRTLLYANEVGVRLFELPSLEAMAQRHFMEFFAPEERQRILGYIVAREKGEPAPTNYEVMALKADGRSFPLAVQISKVELRDGPAIIMFLEDASERRAARAALEKSERDYRGLFENAHDAILIFEPEGERILDANERASVMYGVPREELLGQSLETFSANVAEGKKRIEEILRAGVLTGYRTEHLRKDGSPLFLDVNASLVDYGGRRAVLSILRDITDRVQAEEALRRSEEEYRLLVESQTDIIVKLTPSGRFTYASPSFCRTFGKSLQELVGGEVNPLIHEDDLATTLRAFAALKAPPHQTSVEHRLRTKQGWRWFSCSYSGLMDEEGGLSGIVGTGQDVTGRKAAESALRESEQRFRALSDSSTAAILIYQDAKILYVNRSMEKLLGYEASELPGVDLGRVLHPDYRDLLLKRAQARQRGEPVLSQYEAPLVRKDGATRWLLISAARILYQGNPAGILAAFDVTEKRDAEERLRQSAHEIRAIFSALPDLYFRLDQEGRILDWRAGKEPVPYFESEPALNSLIEEALPGEAASLVRGALERVLASRALVVVEFPLPAEGGEEVFEAHIAPLFHNQAVAVVRNVTGPKRAQAEIEAWKRRFELVSAASGQVVYDYDLGTGNILWSGSVEQVLGYTPSEMGNIGAWSERLHAEDRPEALRLLDEAEKACTPYDVDYRFQHRSGYYVRVHDRGFFIKGASGQAERMIGMMADVTEIRHVQEAMRRSEERFRRTFDLSPVGAVMVSLEGQFLRCNQAFCSFLGYEEEELAGKHFLDVTSPEDLAAGRDDIRAVAEQTLEKTAIQKRYVRKDGHVVWGEVTIRLVPETEDYPAHFLTVIQDITERKRAEDILKQSEAKFRNLYEQMRDGFAVVTPEGRIIECNEAYCELTGYTRGELVHLTYMDLTPSQWHEMEQRHLEDEILKTGSSSLYEKEYRRKDGTVVPVEVRAQAKLGSGGKVIFMWAIVRDITERKRAEEELVGALHTAQYERAKSEAILAAMGDGISIQDLEFNVLYQNEVHRRLVGDHLGQKCYKSYQCEDTVCEACPVARAFSDGELHTMIQRMDTPQGPRHLEITASPLRDHTGAIVAGIECVRDVTGRMRAEQAIRASELRYRTLMETANDAIFVADAETGLLIDANRKAQDLIGRDFDEICGMHQTQIHPPAERARYEGIFKDHIQRGEAISEDILLQHKDGHTIPAEVSASLFEIDGRTYVQGIFRDVSERKRAEEAVAASEARLRLIVDNVHEIIYSVVFTGGLLSSRTSFVSPQVTNQIGYMPQEFQDDPGLFEKILHPEDVEPTRRIMERFVAEGTGGMRQYRLRHKTTGEYRWMEDRVVLVKDGEGSVVGFQGVARDVTNRKRGEAALLESEKRLRKILELSPISMALVGMDGTIEYINRKSEETFGYLPEDIPTMDRWWAQAYPDEAYRAEVVATWTGLVEKALAEGTEIEGREYRVTCKDGTEKIMLIFGVPVADKVFVMFQDVTDRALAREALQARLEQQTALLENARAIILLWKPDLTVTYWNDFAEEFFGFTREEALGRSLLDTIVPRTDSAGRDLATMIQEIARDVNRFAANINQNLTKDGRRVWVAWSNRPMVDSHGAITGILSIGTDITELKLTESALAESEKRLRVIYDNVQEIVYYLKLGPEPTDLKPTFVNRQIETLLGYTPEEFQRGMETWKAAIHPDDFERVARGTQTLLTDLRPRSREFRARHRLTGEYHWIENAVLPDLDASGRPLGYFGVARDVTERRRSEDLLRLRNRQLMAVAASADAMGRFLDTKRATQAICDAAIDAFGAAMAWVGLVVPESTEITPLSSAGRDEGYTATVRVRWDLSERAMGPVGRAAKTRKPQIMHVAEPAFAPWREEATLRGYQTVCAVPILHGDEVRGVLTIYSDRPDAFGPEIFDIFEVFARQCAMVLVNAALYEEARTTIQELWTLNEQLKGK